MVLRPFAFSAAFFCLPLWGDTLTKQKNHEERVVCFFCHPHEERITSDLINPDE